MATDRPLSADELIEIGRRFDVPVGDREVGSLVRWVNERLGALPDRSDLPSRPPDADPGVGPWHEPAYDRRNPIAHVCHVPPLGDAAGPLEGWRLGVKDNVAVASIPMQCGSRMMEGQIPAHDATVVHRLRSAGATINAKLNMGEFGGAPTSALASPVRNPHDADRSAGGSSSGSAVAVAEEASTRPSVRTPVDRYGSPPRSAESSDSSPPTASSRSPG